MRSPDEIPLSAAPRIVKLHGSVDAHFPLIFTQEDYRTYPAKFAPFVNTVQQAMMESVFLLVGFSGDDPNFLHWSGWVRDNLGDSAPKIYLAGWLELSVHRRRMLENRNIAPIDLASHPKAHLWPKHTRHERSTDWILHTLEHGRPYDPSEWPSPSTLVRSSVPKYLEPVRRNTTIEPKAEPQPPSTGDQSDESKENTVRSLIEVWAYNRTHTYPGWLTAPAAVRSKMWNTRDAAPMILEVLPRMELVDRLNALTELIWRWEIQLEPLSTSETTSLAIVEAARDVLTQIDCERQEIGGVPVAAADWTAIRRAWAVVAAALVTAARIRFDSDEFEQRISALLPFEQDDQEIAHRIHHERCLQAVYSLDFKALENLLQSWDTDCSDPVWMMRKAALLFEIGQREKAHALNTAALSRIRGSYPDDHSFSMLSREAWALYCSGATLSHEEFWYAAVEWRHRWEQLTPFKCNAPQEMRSHADEIRREKRTEDSPHFDLGMAWGKGFSFSQDEFLRWTASHRAVRLAEIAGLPPSTGRIKVTSEYFELAAKQLSPHEPELAARLALRASADDRKSALHFVLSRPKIAIMSGDIAERLASICIHAIEYMLPRIDKSDRRDHWANRLPVIIEALSRLVLRLDPAFVDTVLGKALKCYKEEAIANTVELSGPLRNLISRSWEALPNDLRRSRLLDLLSAPIVGMDGFTAGITGEDGERLFVGQYPDPCNVLDGTEAFADLRTSENETRWSEIVGLVVRGLRSTGESRKRAAGRMTWLAERKLLTVGEESEIADALWGEDYSNHKALPDGTNIYDWAFQVFPEPEEGLAEQRFREKWLQPRPSNDLGASVICDILFRVGTAIHNLGLRGRPLALSTDERSFLADAIETWARESIPTPIPFGGASQEVFIGGSDEDTRNAIAGLQYLVLEIDVPETVAVTLYEKVKSLNTSQMPARSILVGLTRMLPAHFEEIVQLMRMGLASDVERTAKDATRALRFWLQSSRDLAMGLRQPPIELVREIGVAIATRRKAALFQALRSATWVFSEGSQEYRDAIADLATQGLGYLEQELRYDREPVEDIDVPLLRLECTRLAIAMAEHGLEAESVVSKWIKNASADPLPEVRHTDGLTGYT